jgi:hypothetical protein
MKVCTKCGKDKTFDNFVKDKTKKDNYSNKCKSCAKEYYDLNRQKILEQRKEYRQNNKENISILRKITYQEKKYYHKEYYKINKEKIKEYRKKNQHNLKEYHKFYQSKKKKKDPIFKFKSNVRSLISSSFKRGKNEFGKNAKTEQILGCTIEEFRSYIENKFVKDMCFNNYGKWHLDHIIPISIANTEEEIIRLNHYTNFQPLWAEDNFKKGNKIIN